MTATGQACISQASLASLDSDTERGMAPAEAAGVRNELQILPRPPKQIRAFLLAQLHWERYRASRMALVHLLAASALLFWVPLPHWLRAPIAAACAACFLAAAFAGMMEWRWGRERDRRAGVLPPREGD